MQFQVPQFTEIEDKVIGPLTLKQFLYLLIAAIVLFILFRMVNMFVFVLLAIPIASMSLALGFVKVNNRPLIYALKNFLGFLKKPDFYVWKKPTPAAKEEKIPEIIQKKSPKDKSRLIPQEKLQEISWKIEVEK